MSDSLNMQDWDVVYSYTTKQFFEDGGLVMPAEDAGIAEVLAPFFKFPVYATATLAYHIDQAVKDGGGIIDRKGVWYDVGWMAWNAIKRAPQGTNRVIFPVGIYEGGHVHNHDLMVGVGPYDDAGSRPVITICFAAED